MSCGCGSAAQRREILRTAHQSPTSDGGYTLATYPGCTVLYRGPSEGMSIFVVGRNTENERLFPFGELIEASEYAKESFDVIENLPTTAMCADAVISVYGR
jgi:hypothetical protein